MLWNSNSSSVIGLPPAIALISLSNSATDSFVLSVWTPPTENQTPPSRERTSVEKTP